MTILCLYQIYDYIINEIFFRGNISDVLKLKMAPKYNIDYVAIIKNSAWAIRNLEDVLVAIVNGSHPPGARRLGACSVRAGGVSRTPPASWWGPGCRLSNCRRDHSLTHLTGTDGHITNTLTMETNIVALKFH